MVRLPALLVRLRFTTNIMMFIPVILRAPRKSGSRVRLSVGALNLPLSVLSKQSLVRSVTHWGTTGNYDVLANGEN